LSGENWKVMFPIDVSSTARYFDSSPDDSVVNGSGAAAGLSRMVTFVMTTRCFGTVLSASTCEIFCATLSPSATRANTVY
jgi:hypothetical protein